MKNYVIAGFLLIILTVASLILPSQILRWQDAQRTEKSETEEVQEVVLREQVSMTLSEKLRLQKKEEENALTLVNGKNFNKDTIEEQMKKEIRILAEKEILIDFDTDILDMNEATVSFYVDMEDSERSTMFWLGSVDSPKNYLSFFLDDETGKIVSFHQFRYANKRDLGYAEAYDGDSAASSYSVSVSENFMSIDGEELKKIAERWGEYLGYQATGGDFYRYDVSSEEGEAFMIEVERLMSKGYSYKEAEQMTAMAWGIDPDAGDAYRVILEDSGGTIPYNLEISPLQFEVTAYMPE
ncbi:hypothetical protein D5278_14595 [bacterium 1XD21-13]|nr:hypothetical protein [bacterium 1XD21-13]